MPDDRSLQPTVPLLRRKSILAVAAALLVGLLALLYWVKPDGVPFYPKCVFHLVTGLDCPGCGATRALNRLLHGQFVEAWQYNPLFISILLPCALYWFIRFAWSVWYDTKFSSQLLPNWAAWSLLVLVLVFGIVRNTPLYPFRTWELDKQLSASRQPESASP